MKVVSKNIRVNCEGVNVAPWSRFVAFQDDLKTLTSANYLKLRDLIVEFGFSEALTCWQRGDDIVILNGHQRIECVKRMVQQEGYTCPDLPFNFVTVTDEQEAELRVLGLTSDFGEMTEDSLVEYMRKRNIPIKRITESFTLRQVNEASLVKRFDENAKKVDEKVSRDLPPQFIVTVEVGDEIEQRNLYEELMGKGYACRLIN